MFITYMFLSCLSLSRSRISASSTSSLLGVGGAETASSFTMHDAADCFYHYEDAERNNQEVQYILHEASIFYYGFPYTERQAVHVDTSGQYANQGHKDIADKRTDYFSECASHDNTDSHIDYISFHGKRFEFFDKAHILYLFYWLQEQRYGLYL